jgi:hypothetical protein
MLNPVFLNIPYPEYSICSNFLKVYEQNLIEYNEAYEKLLANSKKVERMTFD